MKTSHEWPQAPPTIKSSSSSRRKLTLDSLTSPDLYISRRYHSYSDGDDDLHARDLREAQCQSSGDTTGIQSSGSGAAYHKGKGIQSSGDAGNRKGFCDAVAIEAMPLTSTKIKSFYKEDKAKLSANRRVDHSSRVPQQPLRFNPCPFPGALKLAGKPNTTKRILPTRAATGENTSLDTREPFSPEVTCLGRVRIKEKQTHETEKSHTEERQTSKDVQRRAPESKKQSADKTHKDVTQKGTSKKEIAEKRSCLPRRKKRESMDLKTFRLFGTSSSAIEPLETMETRRERAALLARSLTSLLEDLRRLDMEDSAYVPAVPPPNSLLLMRGNINKSCNQEVSTLLNENACQSEESSNSTANEDSCKYNDIKAQKSTRAENSAVQSRVSLAPQKVFPLSEIESNSLVQNAASSETNNKRSTSSDCQQELALWQRRAIARLASLEIKGPKRMETKQPSTK